MSRTRRLGGAIALAALALAAAGCGETVIDDVKIEDTIEHNLKVERGEKVRAVECPSGVEVVPKDTFECVVTYRDGTELTAELTIVDDDANVTMTIPDLGRSGSGGGPEQGSRDAG